MPFKKIGPDKYKSIKSGKEYTKEQIRAYYAKKYEEQKKKK
jgi:hypothetical protein